MSGLVILVFGMIALGLAGMAGVANWRGRREVAGILGRRLQGLEAPVAVDPDVDPARADILQAALESAPAGVQILLARAGGAPSAAAAGIYALVASLIVIVLGRLFGAIPAAVALAVALIAPLVALQVVAGRRAAAFVDALPHFLDSLRQLLIVGQSFQLAFLRATDEAPLAIRRYLEPATRRIQNGGHVADALGLAGDRVAIAEFQMLTAAVRLNLRFGGPLGADPGELGGALRSRARIAREVGAATAETRMSAAILAALPLAAIGLLLVVNPTYVAFLWETDTGRRMLAVAGTLQVIGMLVLRRLMRVDF